MLRQYSPARSSTISLNGQHDLEDAAPDLLERFGGGSSKTAPVEQVVSSSVRAFLDAMYAEVRAAKDAAVTAAAAAERGEMAHYEMRREVAGLGVHVRQIAVAHQDLMRGLDDLTKIVQEICNSWPVSYKRKSTEISSPVVPGLSLDNNVSAYARHHMPWIAKNNLPKRTLQKDWIVMVGQPDIRVTGTKLASVVNGATDLDHSLADGAVKLCNEEQSVLAADPSHQPRLFVPIAFVLDALGVVLSDLTAVEMLAESCIGFDVRRCHEIVAVVPDKQSWSCFSWDIETMMFSVADSGMFGKTPRLVERKHGQAFTLLHTKLVQVLRELHEDNTLCGGIWSKRFHNQVGRDVAKNDSGVFSVICSRVFHCASGSIDCDSYDVRQSTMDLLYRLVHHEHNTGEWLAPPGGPGGVVDPSVADADAASIE